MATNRDVSSPTSVVQRAQFVSLVFFLYRCALECLDAISVILGIGNEVITMRLKCRLCYLLEMTVDLKYSRPF